MEKIGTSREQMKTSDHQVSIDIYKLGRSMREELENLNPLSDECCIYRVPKRLRLLNEKAYTPQVVSIGPFHHGREELKAMEEYKRRYLDDFLARKEPTVEDLIELTKEREARLRNCYAEVVELESEDFVRMMLLDAAFVIMVMVKYHSRDFGSSNDRVFDRPWMIYDIRFDMILLENQLPFFFLEDLLALSKPYLGYSMIELTCNFLKNTLLSWVTKDMHKTNAPPVKHIVHFLRICQHPQLQEEPKVPEDMDKTNAPRVEQVVDLPRIRQHPPKLQEEPKDPEEPLCMLQMLQLEPKLPEEFICRTEIDDGLRFQETEIRQHPPELQEEPKDPEEPKVPEDMDKTNGPRVEHVVDLPRIRQHPPKLQEEPKDPEEPLCMLQMLQVEPKFPEEFICRTEIDDGLRFLETEIRQHPPELQVEPKFPREFVCRTGIDDGLRFLEPEIRQHRPELPEEPKDPEEPKKPVRLTLRSVTELRQFGVRFQGTESKNLFDIKFDKKRGRLGIPRLLVFDHTETLLRNLQAFEACYCSDKYVADYITMINLLVSATGDVEILVQNGIIENFLSGNDAVLNVLHNLANGNSIALGKFYFSDIVGELNVYCRKRRHKWKATLMQNYFNNPWAIISVIAAGILLILTVIQAVCSIIQVTPII